MNSFEFFEWLRKTDRLADFMFRCVFRCDAPGNPSVELLEALEDRFFRLKCNDTILGKDDFKRLCEAYKEVCGNGEL